MMKTVRPAETPFINVSIFSVSSKSLTGYSKHIFRSAIHDALFHGRPMVITFCGFPLSLGVALIPCMLHVLSVL
jgi:hypothetical protein